MQPATLPAEVLTLGPGGLPVIPALDIAAGYPLGVQPPVEGTTPSAPDPAAALRAALLPALRRPPCVVAFSGGRDSALLLALAADEAARHGLPAPVALTFRYPGDPAADESSWQELVIGALAVHWERREITGELDLIGPVLAPVLRAHGGPTFPAALANTILLAGHAGGGTLVTGNGGDEVLGGHRLPVLRAAFRTARRRRGGGLTRGDWRQVALAAAPARARRGGAAAVEPWQRAPVRAALRRQVARKPLRWDRSVRAALTPRAVDIGNRTRARVVADAGCALIEPLADPGFVASYAAFGGRWGGLTRTAGVRLLAGGVLPEAVVTRRSKAYFNASRFGPASREFARGWDGTGVDEELVDPHLLRAAWLSDTPPAAGAMLLQQAWLAERGQS